MTLLIGYQGCEKVMIGLPVTCHHFLVLVASHIICLLYPRVKESPDLSSKMLDIEFKCHTQRQKGIHPWWKNWKNQVLQNKWQHPLVNIQLKAGKVGVRIILQHPLLICTDHCICLRNCCNTWNQSWGLKARVGSISKHPSSTLQSSSWRGQHLTVLYSWSM